MQQIAQKMSELYSQQVKFHGMFTTAKKKFQALHKEVKQCHDLALNREEVVKKLASSAQQITDAVEEDIHGKYLHVLFKLARTFEKAVAIWQASGGSNGGKT